jgi:hypothetical protein
VHPTSITFLRDPIPTSPTGAGRLPLAESIEPEWSWISARDARLEAAERIIHNHEERGMGMDRKTSADFSIFFGFA